MTCAINQDIETGIYVRCDPVVPIKQLDGVGLTPEVVRLSSASAEYII